MKTYYFFLSFLIIFFTSCSKGDNSISEQMANGSKVIVCSYDEIKKTNNIPLSHLVAECKLIHFEDIDDALFNPWFTTVTDKYIGIRQQDGGVYKLFDSSGKFLCDVGSVGQGPGEYAGSLYDDLIDDKNQLVYLVPMYGDKIYIYNTSGKFVKNIIAPQQLHKPRLHLSDDGILSVVHMAFDGEKAVAMQFDKDGNVIKSLEPLSHLLVDNYNGEIFNTRNTAMFEFAHTSSDTLYHYSKERNKIEPIINLEFSSSEKPFRQYIKVSDYYLINVFENNKIVAANIKDKTSSFVTIKNDFFGDLNVFVNVVSFRNGWYIKNLEPGQLITEIDDRLKESDCSQQDKDKLIKLRNSLDENTNNIMFVGKIK